MLKTIACQHIVSRYEVLVGVFLLGTRTFPGSR